MPSNNLFLSVVIPAYKKADVIEKTVLTIISEIRSLGFSFELIVVVDGDQDQTSRILSGIKATELKYLVSSLNRGKGYAVKTGIQHVTGGKYCVLLDADLDISPKAVAKALNILESDPKIGLALGSKFHSDSVCNYSLFRKGQSKIYSKVVRTLFNLNVSETQTGVKVGRTHLMKQALNDLTSEGFAFDLEFVLRLRELDCEFAEYPVELNHGSTSTVSLLRALQTLKETFQIYWSIQRQNGGRS